MLRYFATLSAGRTALWCYLLWYVTIVSFYFQWSLRLWLSALGMSAIIGTALVLSTSGGGVRPERWTLFRLFLMPFCVSSYSALIVGKGFYLIFPPDLLPNLVGLATCTGFILIRYALKLRMFRQL